MFFVGAPRLVSSYKLFSNNHHPSEATTQEILGASAIERVGNEGMTDGLACVAWRTARLTLPLTRKRIDATSLSGGRKGYRPAERRAPSVLFVCRFQG